MIHIQYYSQMGYLKRTCLFLFIFSSITSLLRSHPIIFFTPYYQNITQYNWFDSVFLQAEKFYKNGIYDEALKAFQTASIMARYKNKEEKYIECGFYKGLCCWNLGRIKDSYKEYSHLLDRSVMNHLADKQDELKKALGVISLYMNGMELRESKKLDGSLQAFQEAADISEKISRKEFKQRILRQISIVYWDKKDLNQFYHFNVLSLEVAEQMKNKEEIGKCLNNIGIFHWKSFEYSKALSIYDRALDISTEMNNLNEESNTLHNIGLVYKDFGYYNKAMDYLKKALEIDLETGSCEYFPTDYLNIGIVYKSKAEEENKKELVCEAIECFKKSLSYINKNSNQVIEIKNLNNIGSSYIEIDAFSEALPYLQRSFKKANEINDYESMSMVLNNIGYVHLRTQEYDEAVRFFRQSVKLAEKNKAYHILWEAYFGLGKIQEQKGRISEAVENYLKSIRAIETIKDRIVLDVHNAGFIQNKLKVYESLMDLLFSVYEKNPNTENGEKIFHIAERAKAQVLLENLMNVKVQGKEKRGFAKKEPGQEISKILDLDPKKASNLNFFKEIDKERKKDHFYQSEERYINMINRRYVEGDTIKDKEKAVFYVLEEVQSYLKNSKAVLFEYFLGEERSYLFVVTSRDLKVFPLPSNALIANSIYGYLKLLRSPPKGEFKGEIASKRIYKELLYPLRRLDPNSFKNIIIIPSGILYYLPFETLIGPQHKDAYLVSRYRISYMPSSVSLLYLSMNRKVKTYKKDLLAFGNPIKKEGTENGYNSSNILIHLYENQDFKFSPLPFSEREINLISKLFKEEKRDVFLRDEASEKVIKKITLSDYRIIHFSCHGFIDENYPFRSSLVLSLADGKGEDGFLQVKEIYDLEMMPQLVVLSACQTGRGTLKRGEGVLGLPRVFFYAGAQSILSSLWRVRDKQTARFMNLFYTYLASGKSKAQSLQLAKIDFIESKKYSTPFYWAPFILNGEFLGAVNF